MLRLWGQGYLLISINFLALSRIAAVSAPLGPRGTYDLLGHKFKLIRQADLGMPPAEAGAERGQAFAARGGLSAPLGPGGTYDL